MHPHEAPFSIYTKQVEINKMLKMSQWSAIKIYTWTLCVYTVWYIHIILYIYTKAIFIYMYIYILHNMTIGFCTGLHCVLKIMCNIWNKPLWKQNLKILRAPSQFSSRSEGNCPMNLWPQPSHHHSLLNSSPCYHDQPEHLQKEKETDHQKKMHKY